MLLSCDSGDSNGAGSDTFSLNKDSFNLTVTEGGTESEFSGETVFGIGSEASSSDEEAVVVYMLDGTKKLDEDGDVIGGWTEVIIRDRRDIDIPSTGEWVISRWDKNSQELRSFYGTIGGTVQITSSTDSELEGTFNFSAFSATVEGSFTAEHRPGQSGHLRARL